MALLTNRQQDCLRDALGYLDNATGALQELIEVGHLTALGGTDTFSTLDRIETIVSQKRRELTTVAEGLGVQDPAALYEEYRTAVLALQKAPGEYDLDWAMGQPYGDKNRGAALRIHTDALAAFLPVAQKFLKQLA